MDEYEDAARSIGQGIRNLRDLIDAERQRQGIAANEAGQAGEQDAAGEPGNAQAGSV